MAEIVREHYPAVYRFCARRIGPDLAEDAAQETFLTAQKSLKRFDGRSSFSTWLFGIAHNHCRALSRKRKAETPLEDIWLGETMATSGQESQVIDREALRVALAKLSPEHREVVLLHEIEGLSYGEAAEVLGVPAGTVKSRLHHAFLNLRRALGSPDGVTA
jgi:RNA polymerase sigma-70 factor, ECF subfamily